MSNLVPTPHHFRTAVKAILKNWTALQLAVSQGAAGGQSQAFTSWLAEALVTWFSENRNLESYEVAEFLETILDQELNLMVDDGSTDEVGTLLCDFFVICSTKSEAEVIEKVRGLPRCDLSRCHVENNEGDSTEGGTEIEEGIDGMDIDEPKPSRAPRGGVVDEEGWTTIVSRKKQ